MFCAPFVLLAVSYSAAPQELPVLRAGIGHTVLLAPKSLFMVFRVPVMNLIHGLMAAVMLSHASTFANTDFPNTVRRTSYWNMFATLLLTIPLKADFEGLEFYASVSPALHPYERWLGPGTLLCVVVGLGLTIRAGRKDRSLRLIRNVHSNRGRVGSSRTSSMSGSPQTSCGIPNIRNYPCQSA